MKKNNLSLSYWKVEFNAEILDRDLYIWLETIKRKFNKILNGSIIHITKSIMEERQLYQKNKKLSALSSNLDTLINLYQDMITQLETLKKKLL